MVAFAAPGNFRELVQIFVDLVNPIIGLLTSLALLLFFWGIVKYISHAGDETKAKEAKYTIVYGVIALTVLFSFWGIVYFFMDSIFSL